MAARLETALPPIITFVFGLAFGLVAGHVLWAERGSGGGAPRTGEAPPTGMASQGAPAGGEAAMQAAAEAERAQLEERLVMHEKLLEAQPDDARLLRTVGNYNALLDDHERAMELYRRAEAALAAQGGTSADQAQLLVDIAVAHADLGDVEAALETIDRAQVLDATDVRSRLTEAAILLTRVMPAPPPGFERKAAVARAEGALAEVRALEPDNPHARELQGWIDSVREGMSRGAVPAGGAVPAEAATAPTGATAPAP